MKEFIALLVLVLAVVSSCSGDNVGEFEEQHDHLELCEEAISGYLVSLAGIDDAVVQINGSMVVVGLDLADEVRDEHIKGLKRQIIRDIKDIDDGIRHVAVTTSLDLYNKVITPEGAECCHEILDDDNEIFEITVPSL